MKKLIEYVDGFRWIDGDTSSAPFKKDSDLYNEKLAEGFKLELMPQAEKAAHEASEAIAQAESTFVQTMAPITATATQLERDTWAVQEREARAYMEDSSANVPFITQLASARNIGLTELAQRIITKADAYSTALATALGQKHKAEDEIGANV